MVILLLQINIRVEIELFNIDVEVKKHLERRFCLKYHIYSFNIKKNNIY